jgi:hypothetical protein
MNKSLIAEAEESKSWPFEEARKILKRLEKNKKDVFSKQVMDHLDYHILVLLVKLQEHQW